MVTKQVWERNNFRKCIMSYNRTLEHMPYAQAGVVYGKDEEAEYQALYSYTTCVAWVYDNGWYGCRGTYSQTTRKHIGAFAKEFGLSYYDFKRCFEKGVEVNRFTGEERKVKA